jgi:nuclear migration protein JNM1
MEENDTARKVDALYASLATIDRLAPVVPGILDRLRGMTVVHADAAGVTVGLKDLEGRLAGMEKEAKGWKDALSKVESSLKEVAGRVGGAVEVTEEVVKGLEMRMKKLET